MEALITFAVWAGLFFVMMRLGCGAHVAGHAAGKRGEPTSRVVRPDAPALRWVAPEADTDPVCGNAVHPADTDPTRARPSVYDGQVYYFCSRDCREIFEAAPHTYVAAGRDPSDGTSTADARETNDDG